jgi:CheY-like chemotaxis protein
LPIDKIKIDRSFITEIISDPSSAAITRATIAMAHALQIKVIAEGVEDQEQLAFLQRLGCDEIQGYFYSRPVPAGEFAALLQNRPTLRLGATEHDAAQRVLIVDDEPAILSSLKRELSLNGFEVETAANAEEGFSILARQLIPVVISDFNMPGLSGPDFLERVKKLHPQTVRVAISGAHDLELMARAINKGSVFKFIFKPWTEEQLIDIMEESFRYYHASANLAGEGI